VPVPAGSMTTLSGVKVALGPRVVIDPTFGVGLATWRRKLPTPRDVSIASNATLLLTGELHGLRIESLDLKGALVLKMCAGANVTLRRVRVSNSGWKFKSFGDGSKVDEALAIRGYRVEKNQQRELVFDRPGEYIIEDEEDASTCTVG